MRRISTFLMTAAAVLFVAGLSAQAPNLTGKWMRADDPAAAGGGGGRGGRGGGGGLGAFNCGMTCDIKQDAKALTITRTQQGRGEGAQPQTITTTINLSGESKITMPGRGGEQTITATAKTDGNRLVITTTRDMGGSPVTITQTISMAGGDMVVETQAPGREGGMATTKTVYKKG